MTHCGTLAVPAALSLWHDSTRVDRRDVQQLVELQVEGLRRTASGTCVHWQVRMGCCSLSLSCTRSRLASFANVCSEVAQGNLVGNASSDRHHADSECSFRFKVSEHIRIHTPHCEKIFAEITVLSRFLLNNKAR